MQAPKAKIRKNKTPVAASCPSVRVFPCRLTHIFPIVLVAFFKDYTTNTCYIKSLPQNTILSPENRYTTKSEADELQQGTQILRVRWNTAR